MISAKDGHDKKMMMGLSDFRMPVPIQANSLRFHKA
jgi:hypothetical protein